MRFLVALDHIIFKFDEYRHVAFKSYTYDHLPELTGHYFRWETCERPKCYSNRRSLLPHCVLDMGIDLSVPFRCRHKILEVLVVCRPSAHPVFGP